MQLSLTFRYNSLSQHNLQNWHVHGIHINYELSTILYTIREPLRVRSLSDKIVHSTVSDHLNLASGQAPLMSHELIGGLTGLLLIGVLPRQARQATTLTSISLM